MRGSAIFLALRLGLEFAVKEGLDVREMVIFFAPCPTAESILTPGSKFGPWLISNERYHEGGKILGDKVYDSDSM